MGVTVKIKRKINTKKIAGMIGKSEPFWLATTVEYWRLITPYTPYQTGALAEKQVRVEAHRIHYLVDYAKKNYFYNRNPRRDKHPKATSYWDKVAMKTEKRKLINAMRGFVRKYRVFERGFNG